MLQERGRGGCDRRKNEIGLERDEFLREPLSRLPVVGRRPARVELDVAAFHPPELLKCLAECGEERWPFQVVLGVAHQHTDPPHSVRLRTRGKWPRSRRARNNFYEISPPHVLPPRGSGRRYRIGLRQNPRIKSPLSNPAMSALGQKRTCAAHKVMSALAQKRTCAVQLLQSHSRPKAMVRTVSGAPTLKYAQ